MTYPTADAQFTDYLQGVPSKLVPLRDGTYAEAIIALQPLAPTNYDYVSLGYTGTNLTTVQYYQGGASGTLMVTLTLAYDGSNNLISVTRS